MKKQFYIFLAIAIAVSIAGYVHKRPGKHSNETVRIVSLGHYAQQGVRMAENGRIHYGGNSNVDLTSYPCLIPKKHLQNLRNGASLESQSLLNKITWLGYIEQKNGEKDLYGEDARGIQVMLSEGTLMRLQPRSIEKLEQTLLETCSNF